MSAKVIFSYAKLWKLMIDKKIKPNCTVNCIYTDGKEIEFKIDSKK